MKYFTFTQRSLITLTIGLIGLLGINLTAVANASSTVLSQVVNAATFSNLVSTSTFADDNDNAPFTVSGNYTAGSTDADYDLTTGNGATGTRRGQITYTLTGPTGQTTATLLTNQPLGSTGLSFSANDSDYPVATTYHLHIHVIPATAFTVSPKAVTSPTSSLSGLSNGSSHTVTTTNDPVTIASANKGYSDGYYALGANLSLAIPAGTHAGTYTGQVVETIN